MSKNACVKCSNASWICVDCMKKVAILQSNYIPWKGYFDLIAAVDEFILYDDMQYTRRDWRNRNKIKTPQGLMWCTVPVKVKGKYFQEIKNTEIDGTDWAKQHWRSMEQHYKKAAHFAEIASFVAPLYAQEYKTISDSNRAFIVAICDYIGITTRITSSSDYVLADGKTERLVGLCEQAGATEYISGPAAKDYVVPELFEEANISLTWFDYAGYPQYPQLWGEFEHAVSILDLLFNCGKSAPSYMRYVR